MTRNSGQIRADLMFELEADRVGQPVTKAAPSGAAISRGREAIRLGSIKAHIATNAPRLGSVAI